MVTGTQQNTSHAVMAQRHEAHDSLDDFPTPPWGTRALMEFLESKGFPLGLCWEPACNRGYMARPLAEYFAAVMGSDIHDYGHGYAAADFLFLFPADNVRPDWIITNPPFRLAEQFIAKALATAKIGCAMLVRTSFLESVGRYERLFSVTPPTYVAQFVERLPMVKGRVDRNASTATSYAWLIWVHGVTPKPFVWIPPCRSRLERDNDYPVAA